MTQNKLKLSDIYTKIEDFNIIQDNYVILTDIKNVCNHTSLKNYDDNQKTLENLLHVYNELEDALLVYINEVHKENPCIICVDRVGVFFYLPNRNNPSGVSGTVSVIQNDLTTAIPVTTEDLDNTSGFLTVVDLTDYLKDVDVIDNLSSDETDKPLSAAMGKFLLEQIPTNISELTNDSNYINSSNIDTKISTHNNSSTAHSTLFGNKVDKVEGKALSTNDFTNAYKQSLDGLNTNINGKISTHNSDNSAHSSLFNNKVDKVTGKTLSSNDFTNAYKEKIDTLETTVNNKVDKIEGKVLSTNDFNNTYKQSLDNLETNVNGKISFHDSDDSAHSNLFSNKVDKVEGKVLSSNDFTNTYKGLLDNLGNSISGRISSHNSDDSAHSDLFNNKVDKVEGKGLSSNDFTNTYKQNLDGLNNNINGKISTHNSDNSAHSGLFNNKVDKVEGKGLSSNDFNDAYKQTIDGLDTTLDTLIYTHNYDELAHSNLIDNHNSDESAHSNLFEQKADVDHTHGFRLVQSYGEPDSNKVINVYANEKTKLCFIHYNVFVNSLNANGSTSVTIDGWLNSNYRPFTVITGVGSSRGMSVLSISGQITHYNGPNTITNESIYGNLLYPYL